MLPSHRTRVVLLAAALLGCARAQDACTEEIAGTETDITVDMESVVMKPGKRRLELEVADTCWGRGVVGAHVVACDSDAAPRVSVSLSEEGNAASVSVQRRGDLLGWSDVLVSLYCGRDGGLLRPSRPPRARDPPRATLVAIASR